MLRVDHPVFFPAACVCGNQSGPQVDTGIERAQQRVYLCSRCIRDAARVDGGWVERTQYEEAVAALARSEQEIARLSEALELEQRPEAKVISISEIPQVVKAVVIDLEKERAKRRPATPKAAGA